MLLTVKQMMRIGWKQCLVSLFLIICLLLLGTILGVLSWNAKRLSQQVQQQLGVFVYLRDDAGQQAVKFVAELEQAGLQTTFFSKDDAFRILAKKLPNVLENLEKYGIENPLPPTMYIIYKNQEEYESMKAIVSRFSDSISTLDNLGLQSSFQEQTRRASKLVSMMNVLRIVSGVLIVGVVIMIGMIIAYVVTALFYRFQQQIELTALLGGSRIKTILPFLIIIFIILILAWLLSGIISMMSIARLEVYFKEVFETSFKSVYLPSGKWTIWYLIELGALILLGLLLVDVQVRLFLRKSK